MLVRVLVLMVWKGDVQGEEVGVPLPPQLTCVCVRVRRMCTNAYMHKGWYAYARSTVLIREEWDSVEQ